MFNATDLCKRLGIRSAPVLTLDTQFDSCEQAASTSEQFTNVGVYILKHVDYVRCILLIKQSSKLLTAPGGGIDSGETVHDAALRELYEETGMIPSSSVKLSMKIAAVMSNRTTALVTCAVKAGDMSLGRSAFNSRDASNARTSGDIGLSVHWVSIDELVKKTNDVSDATSVYVTDIDGTNHQLRSCTVRGIQQLVRSHKL